MAVGSAASSARWRWRGLRAALATAWILAACQASTTRPSFTAFPEAARAEVQLSQEAATKELAQALTQDSIPVSRVEPRDGWLETRWFDAKTLQPTTRRPVGRDIVKVRGWANPAKPGFSEYEVETVFVPFIDPSRPARELESIVPGDHPVAKRVAATVKRLFDKYGEPVPAPPPSPGAKPRVDSTSKALPARPDSAKADTSRKPRADSTGKVSPTRPDSAKADTNRKPAPPPPPPPPAPPSPLGGRR